MVRPLLQLELVPLDVNNLRAFMGLGLYNSSLKYYRTLLIYLVFKYTANRCPQVGY